MTTRLTQLHSVGKGRELAACMLNHIRFHSAARKFVFVTASASLETDIRRDLGAVGWPFKTHPLRSMDVSADKPVPITKGILFITYSLLRTKGGGKRSRLDQVLAWLKTAGIEHPFLAFDEVHLAKGKTCTNAVVRELQTKLPNARVVYASATAGSTVQHLSCMPRLGLWGEGTPFPNHEAFAMRYKAACNSTMETVSTELAARGAFLSRRLSFADTTFDTQTAALTDEQTELHSRLCAWFAKLIALDVFDTKEGKAVLWGTHLRIFKALLIAFRVAAARDAAAAWIEAGGAVVVSLIGTGEAASARLADDADDDGCIEDSAFAGLRSTLSEIMDKASATDAAVSHGDALLALRTEVDEFDLPPSPLDALVDQLGSVGRVIELTGRSNAWTRGEDGKWAQQKRSSGDNTELCKEFQRGDAEIAIISAAASTGEHPYPRHPPRHPNAKLTVYSCDTF